MRRYRFAIQPGWVLLHLLTVALVVTMSLLGRWQLDVAENHDFNIRNAGYALQWWAFSAFALVMWFKIMRDRVRHDGELPEVPGATAPATSKEPVAYRRYVAPTSAPAEDDTLAAYNDYLARLNAPDGSP